MANLDNLLEALETACSPKGLGLSARHITISTVGLPVKIKQLADTGKQYHLAVSLHAPNDEIRSKIVPTNSKIGIYEVLDAADYFLAKQERSLGVSDEEKLKIAIKSLGLDDLAPFNPKKKIIEYVLEQKMGSRNRLISMSARQLANETSSESPAPGGGSVSAYVGALGASLGVMVANLSSHKRGWDIRWKEFSDVAQRGMEIQKELLRLVDEDTHAFNQIMEAFGLPKGTEDEKKFRSAAIESASKYAMEIPLRTAEVALDAMEICWQMVNEGNPNSITDAGVGALCIRAAVLGAVMNVKVNAGGIQDKGFTTSLIEKADLYQEEVIAMEQKIRTKVEGTFA
jgi:glutamate formiminotransferase/formiminotetrahydrofolate cyclodeaminase